mgnify:FL=1|jgi:hypothetical protein
MKQTLCKSVVSLMCIGMLLFLNVNTTYAQVSEKNDISELELANPNAVYSEYGADLDAEDISFFENCGIDIKNNSLIEMTPIQNNGRTTDNTYVLQVTNIEGQEITSSTLLPFENNTANPGIELWDIGVIPASPDNSWLHSVSAKYSKSNVVLNGTIRYNVYQYGSLTCYFTPVSCELSLASNKSGSKCTKIWGTYQCGGALVDKATSNKVIQSGYVLKTNISVSNPAIGSTAVKHSNFNRTDAVIQSTGLYAGNLYEIYFSLSNGTTGGGTIIYNGGVIG